MAPVDDETLLQEVRARRPDAWERLIAAYQGRLLAFAEQRLGDRAAAEDVVQETFLGFLLALPNYRDATPLESFLFSIAAHKLTDHLAPLQAAAAEPSTAAAEVRREDEAAGGERTGSL